MAPPQKAVDLKNQGNAAFQAKKYDEAIKLYSAAIGECDSEHTFYTNRAAAYTGLQQWDKVLEDGLKCISLKEDFAKGHYRAGLALFHLARPKDAVPYLERAVQLDAKSAEIKERLADAKEAARKLQHAANASRTNPDGSKMTPSQLARADANDLYRESKYEEAIKAYTKCLALTTDEGERGTILSNRAACHRQVGANALAIEDCTEALRLRPNDVKCLTRRGFAYEGVEKYEQALADMRQATMLAGPQGAPQAFAAIPRLQKSVEMEKKLRQG